MRLVTNGKLEMAVVVHVDDIMSVGDRAPCEQFGRDLNKHFPVKFLGGLEMYAGIRFTRRGHQGAADFPRSVSQLPLVRF